MTMKRQTAAVILVLIAGCSSPASHAHRGNVTAAGPWPTARPAAPNDPPKILALRLSATRVRPGQDWIGRVATTKNVASLEVRAPSFTFSAPRPSFGQFAFRIHTLYIPPLYRRVYTVEFIARNAAGAADERDVDVDFR